MIKLTYREELVHLERCAGENCRENVLAAHKNSTLSTLDSSLERDVYFMSDAIMNDPVKPKKTPELGLSQAHRLHRFLSDSQNPNSSLSDLYGHLSELNNLGLPVIGAEFHLPANQEVERLEEKLFVLNMAQYQNGSLIPLSKIEEDLVEIRMNPSYFPVTMANWELMRRLVPIDKTSFFLSITPLPENEKQLDDIKSLANILYSSQYEIQAERNYNFLRKYSSAVAAGVGAAAAGVGAVAGVAVAAGVGAVAGVAVAAVAGAGVAVAGVAAAGVEPCLGEYYLGQTQKLEGGEYKLTSAHREINGKIPAKREDECQLNLYSGFGNVFPEQAYYLSMAYIAPEILETVREKAGVVSLRKASKMHPEKIQDILTTINSQILDNPNTRRATEIGQEIKGVFLYNMIK